MLAGLFYHSMKMRSYKQTLYFYKEVTDRHILRNPIRSASSPDRFYEPIWRNLPWVSSENEEIAKGIPTFNRSGRRIANRPRRCERSEAIQAGARIPDCRVASLLATTSEHDVILL